MPRIDTIQQPVFEPTYSGQPKYCALFFGPQRGDIVWLVLDRDNIYVDRQAHGDLTGDERRVKLPARRYGVPIDAGHVFPASVDGPVRLKLHQFLIGNEVTIYLHAWFADGTREGASPIWSPAPPQAPHIHFFGPLTFAPCRASPTIARGVPAKLEVQLGRPGIGERSFAWRNHSDVPRDIHPLAEIHYPGGSPVNSPIVASYSLNERCCGCRFFRSILPGNDVVSGQADVVVSFDEWTAGTIVPGRFTIACQ